jgi:hypothetical protein
MRVRTSLAAAIVIATLGCSSPFEQFTFPIVGRVTAADGTPIRGAVLHFRVLGGAECMVPGSILPAASTDTAGRFATRYTTEGGYEPRACLEVSVTVPAGATTPVAVVRSAPVTFDPHDIQPEYRVDVVLPRALTERANVALQLTGRGEHPVVLGPPSSHNRVRHAHRIQAGS